MKAEAKGDRDILVFAFRYALGRMSTAPSMVADELKNNWKYFESWEKQKIKEEIQEALEDGKAGMDCDRATWQGVMDFANSSKPSSSTDKDSRGKK